MNKLIAFSVTVALLALGGCASNTPRPEYRSFDESEMVDDTQRVSDLNRSQQEDICRSVNGYVDTYVGFDALTRLVCHPLAVVLSLGNRRNCEVAYQECVDGLMISPITIQARVSDTEACADQLASCSGTVAQLDGCVDLRLDFLESLVENFSCAGDLSEEMRAQASEAMTSSTFSGCTAFQAACGPILDEQLF